MKIIYYSSWLLFRIISKFVFRIKVSGQQHIPKKSGFILATNHISYYDPIIVGSWINRQIYFLAKKELFKNKFFAWILKGTNSLPVRRGGFDRKALELSINVITNGNGLTFFPEGTRSKTDNFLDPKPGIGMIAIKAKCPVIPGYIHGSNHLKDCFFGKQRLSITFGEHIPSEWLASLPENKESYHKIAQAVMDKIGQLKEKVISLK